MLEITTKEELESIIKEGKVIVDFFATWCGPCKMLAPELEELEEENKDIKVVEIDVDKARSLAISKGIQAVPTLYFYQDGKEIAVRQGFRPKDDLLAIFR